MSLLKKPKSYISVLLALCLLFSAAYPAFAESTDDGLGQTGAVLVIENKTVTADDDRVTIAFTLENAGQLSSIVISGLSYYSSYFELSGAEWLLSDSIISNWSYTDGSGMTAFAENTDADGVVLKLTFDIKDETEAGYAYPVDCSITAKAQTASGTEEDVSITVTVGYIIIADVVKGDVNGDGAVTSKDAFSVLNHILVPSINEVSQDCDFDGDGEVKAEDALYLLYHTFFPTLYPLTHAAATNDEVLGISLSESFIETYKGYQETVTATLYPAAAAGGTVTWSSSDTGVATVSDGFITGVAGGTAVISATSENGKTARMLVSVSDADPLVATGYYYSVLDTAGKRVYTDIYECLASTQEYLTEASFLGHTVFTEEFGSYISSILYMITCDHPELFHVHNSYGLSKDADEILTGLSFQYTMTAAEYQTALATVDSAVSDIISQANSKTDESDKVLVLYNYVKSVFEYDLQFAETSYNLYGALTTGKGVCEAYSELFSFLLRKVGIASVLVDGRAGNEDHQWNIARINGKWYHFDPTYDDPTGTQTAGALYLNYFAVNKDMIAQDHTTINNEDMLPAATSLDDNFYVKNGLVLTSLDDAALKDIAESSYALCGHVAFTTTEELFNTITGSDSSYPLTLIKYADASASGYKLVKNEISNVIEVFRK